MNIKLLFVLVATMLSMASCNPNSQKWKVGGKNVNSSTFELHGGQSAIYGGNLKNFHFKAQITHSEGTKASFWVHSEKNLTKGYSILIGNPSDDRRRSGSLSSIRNRYKSSASSFDFEIKVEGKQVQVLIDSMKVVDYLEPANPYRLPVNAAQLFSSGLIGFRVESGTLNVTDANISILADDLPNYPAEKEPFNEQNDKVIRLQQQNFPVIDYHVHASRRELNWEEWHEKSLADGVEYTFAFNSGIGHQFQSNEQVANFFANNPRLPFFYAMQGEGREWVEIFSKESREMFDLIFADHLTFHDHKGRRIRLWVESEPIIDIPEQEYMDMIIDRTIKMLNEEPIDIWVNATRLAIPMMENYDTLWTDERIAKVVKALKDNNIALEINARDKVPSAKIIKAAKAAGVKFALGTNNNNVQQLDRLEYPIRMVEECGLTIDDMWFPKEK